MTYPLGKARVIVPRTKVGLGGIMAKQLSLLRARHTTAKKRYKRAIPRHAFSFEVPLNNGKIQKIKILARVRHATKPVDLELIEPDVDKSIKMKGRGNMATCAMAQCADRL